MCTFLIFRLLITNIKLNFHIVMHNDRSWFHYNYLLPSLFKSILSNNKIILSQTISKKFKLRKAVFVVIEQINIFGFIQWLFMCLNFTVISKQTIFKLKQLTQNQSWLNLTQKKIYHRNSIEVQLLNIWHLSHFDNILFLSKGSIVC